MRCLNCHRDGIREEHATCPTCGAYLPSLLQHTLPPGTLLRNGNYRIDFALDTGGFGTIYRAVHIPLDCLVAIKEFYPRAYGMRGYGGVVNVSYEHIRTFEAERNQFLQEGRILAGLDHRGIVDVLDLFAERNTAYLVMELLNGETLRRRLEKQPKGLPPDLVRKIVRQLVITLETLHRHKPPIYHLDIKPENVFLTSSQRAVLIDFGAARFGMDGYVIPQYDPLYAPPELLSSKGEVGPQSDLFELAMTAYELLTGRRPPPIQARVYDKNWNVANLSDPWRSVLEPALQISKDKRPSSVLAWWVKTMGAGLPPFFRDKIEIFLDPEEAQVLLEKRLAERHVEYNDLAERKSRVQQLLAKRERELEEKKKALHAAKSQEKGEKNIQAKLQEDTRQKRILEEKLRKKTNEVDTLRKQKEILEGKLQKKEDELQESIKQRQILTTNLIDLGNKYNNQKNR
jgi:serine/threonine protein kinase